MDARQVSEQLASRAREVAEMLLPNGSSKSGRWTVGSLDGEKGQSMSVNLTGPHRGRWKDFATGEGGDLLDLFAYRNGQSIAEGMREACRFLGVEQRAPLRPQKSYSAPARPALTKPRERVMDYLRSRGLTESTIVDFKLAASPQDDAVIFPFLRDGELVNVKTLMLEREGGKKKVFQSKNAEPCLFGWHLIDPKCRSIAITEGEFDCMSLHQLGIPSLSGNQGAGNHQWIDSDWERLQRFSEVFVCYDDDEAGHSGAKEIANRLGIERCKIVRLPKKDANEYLMAGATPEDVRRCLDDARTMDPDELVSATVFVADVIREMYPPDDEVNLDPCLYLGDEQSWFRFRPGEVSIWTGYNGHGKSQLLGQAMLGLMKMDQRVLIFSGEMLGKRLINRAIRQAAGTGTPTIEYIHAISDWFADRFWVYNQVGAASTDRLLEVFAYGAKRYGIRHFVIDSLMMLDDVPEEGKGALEAQRQLMIKLASFAKKYGAHVNLVAHPRKGENEARGPGKQDVSGSGKLTSMADNVFSVWAALRDEHEDSEGAPDGKLELHKQRNGESQNRKIWLWFDPKSCQYRIVRDRASMQFVQFDKTRVNA